MNILTQDIIWGKWAKDILEQLKTDPYLSSDETIRHFRSIMYDFKYRFVYDTEETLQDILSRKKNRMAFEFLMAYYLLLKQNNKITENINRLNDYGYFGIPRHYEEAILLYKISNKDRDFSINGRKISKEIE